MKAIQITFDEELLRELDSTEEVKREGRSAVMRRAVAEYLQRCQALRGVTTQWRRPCRTRSKSFNANEMSGYLSTLTNTFDVDMLST